MELHLRRPGAHVWVVEVRAVVLRVPSLSRIFRDLHPVVLAILYLTGVLERLGEELSEVIVVRGILETEISNVGKVLGELLGEAFAQILDNGGLLLLANLLVLLLVGSSLQALPGETAAEEVEEDVTKGLKIVSSRLLTTQMGVDAHVTSSSRKGFSLAVGNVLFRLGITVLLGHAKVDDVDDAGGLGAGSADEEVVGLDVAVDQVLLVDGLDP